MRPAEMVPELRYSDSSSRIHPSHEARKMHFSSESYSLECWLQLPNIYHHCTENSSRYDAMFRHEIAMLELWVSKRAWDSSCCGLLYSPRPQRGILRDSPWIERLDTTSNDYPIWSCRQIRFFLVVKFMTGTYMGQKFNEKDRGRQIETIQHFAQH